MIAFPLGWGFNHGGGDTEFCGRCHRSKYILPWWRKRRDFEDHQFVWGNKYNQSGGNYAIYFFCLSSTKQKKFKSWGQRVYWGKRKLDFVNLINTLWG